jgi:hypothetical protein
MSLPNIPRKKQTWVKFITNFIPTKIYRQALRGILLLGTKRYKNVIKTDQTKKFKYNLAITAIMKNEGPYLKEWLDYHMLVGVEKFYLYDNESTDDTKEILKPYIKKGIVDYTYWPGKIQQVITYKDSVNKHAEDTKWMAIIDLDEFLVPVKNETLTEYLNTLPKNFAQLIIGWEIYGSSGHKTKQNGLLIENYKKHADKSWGVKSIVNPRLVYNITNPHTHKVAGFTIDENGKKIRHLIQEGNRNITTNKIRCNHYVTKSFEEYVARQKRGSAAQKNTNHRSIEKFKIYDRNEVYDDIMDKYIDKLKKISG